MRRLILVVIFILLCSSVFAEIANDVRFDEQVHNLQQDVATVQRETNTTLEPGIGESEDSWRDAKTTKQQEALYYDARQRLDQMRDEIIECKTATTQHCIAVRQEAAHIIPPLLITAIQRQKDLLSQAQNNQSADVFLHNAQQLTQIRNDMMQLPMDYTYEEVSALRERVHQTLQESYRSIATTRLSTAINKTANVIEREQQALAIIMTARDRFTRHGVDVAALDMQIRKVQSSITDANVHLDRAAYYVRTIDNPRELTLKATKELLDARAELHTAFDALDDARATIERITTRLLQPTLQANPTPLPAVTLPSELFSAFRIFRLDQKEIYAWYPTKQEAQENTYYQELTSTVAKDAPIAKGSYPVILFSHGYLGCAVQSAWLTEELARHGYIVFAINHNDALCDDGLIGEEPNNPSLLEPKKWDETTFADRRDDVDMLTSAIFSGATPFFENIDETKIGVMGHSLGGYTALGSVGGWQAWKNNQIDAALLLSPYTFPYINKSTLGEITVPVMIQGSILDLGITPFQQPIYDQLAGPKYFVILGEDNGLHFLWTVLPCTEQSMNTCLEQQPQRLAADYALDFFDTYLKDKKTDLLQKRPGVFSYVYTD